MRFVRRFSSALRSLVAGITLTGRRRPPAAAPSSRPPRATEDQAAPAPSRQGKPRRRVAAPVPPARPHWLARWFGRKRPGPASRRRARHSDSGNAPFTPQTHPGLSPEVLAILNTPVKDCDPDILRLILAGLAVHLADNLPPDLGMDAKALFSHLCGRLGALPDAARPEDPPAPQQATQDADPAALIQPPGTEAADAPDSAADATAPAPAAWTGRVFRHESSRRFARHRRSHCHPRHARFRRGPAGTLHRPPSRRLCYAACAGPP